jgi:uncharacterized protein (TIGR03435 family)
MKKIQVLMFLIFLAVRLSAQVTVGEPVNGNKTITVLNSQVDSIRFNQLRGKVILLEFWATWCSPCVAAMPHLIELQTNYANNLQVIAVSTDKEKRVKEFIHNRPSNLWFVTDTADEFRKDFPYSTIPHSVLINKQGIVVALTEPQNITTKIIDSLILGHNVHVPIKKDNLTDDPWKAYFSVTPNVRSLFVVQPHIEGLGSAAKNYEKDSVFRNRRISMLNLPLESAYRIAYGNLPHDRIIDKTLKEDVVENKKKYCIDLIVPKGNERDLMPTLRNELSTRFELHADIEKYKKTIYLLQVADINKVALLKKWTGPEMNFTGGQGTFKGIGISFKKIADYLEGYGLVDLPVVDDTGDNDKYDIAFNYMPEKKGDLEMALNNLGFRLIKSEREIDMLVFK